MQVDSDDEGKDTISLPVTRSNYPLPKSYFHKVTYNKRPPLNKQKMNDTKDKENLQKHS